MGKGYFLYDLVKVRRLLNWAFAGSLAKDPETKSALTSVNTKSPKALIEGHWEDKYAYHILKYGTSLVWQRIS